MTTAGRVVHVVDDLEVGGAQRLLVTWAAEAARRAEPVTVVSLAGVEGGIGDALRSAGAEVLAVPRVGGGPLAALGQARSLRRLLAARRPAVVQTHLTRAHLVGLPAAWAARTPSVATLHNTQVGEDGNSGRALRVETLLLRRLADGVVACGAVVERNHRERLAPRQAAVVPNATEPPSPVDVRARAALREELGAGPDAPVLLAVGRLVEQKGYEDLLVAFADVVRSVPDVVLAIAGDGEDREAVAARGAAPDLGGRVRLLGAREDVPALLAAADLYVAASRWEGLPVALLEAMAAGLPVAATAVGDVPTVVDAASGVLVPPRDPAALAAAVIDLLRRPELLPVRGAAARRRVAETSGVTRWYDRMREEHARATARGSSPPGAPGPR